MRFWTAALLAATGGLLVVIPAHADLAGTLVTGTISFATTDTFPLINEYGATVPVGPGPEFDAQYAYDTITADFSGNRLTLTDFVVPVRMNNSIIGAYGWTQTFVDEAFVGFGVTELSDTYDNGGLSYSLVADTLTVHWDGTGELASAADPIYQATLLLPEPSGFPVLIGAFMAVILSLRRLRRTAA